MTPRLSSIAVTDFRSIRGALTVPLDAPVVLIHGQNGAGKTSVLSAIELALTGRIPSLARVDPQYFAHLVHKQAADAHVSVAAALNGTGTATADLVVRDGQLLGPALLPEKSARFFNERCYLPQSTLGRLLEIYQHRERRDSDSPLTEFVKDLLGLDHLDALIDGLHDAGDVRRLRSSVPAYWEVRERIPTVEKRLQEVEESIRQSDARIASTSDRIRERLVALAIAPELVDGTPDVLTSALRAEPEEALLQRIARLRRDLGAALEQAKAVEISTGQARRASLETVAARAEEALNEWRRGPGAALERVLTALALYFPNLPSADTSGPEHARSVAAQVSAAEFQRCSGVLERDEQDAKKLLELSRDLERARARANVLDEQIVQHMAEAGKVAQALVGILPHVATDICPVCQRDFREVSPIQLHAHVARRISTLTVSAGRLDALTRERTEASRIVATTERERDLIASRQLSQQTRDDLKTKRARLSEWNEALSSLATASIKGSQLLSAQVDAVRLLAAHRASDQAATALREWVAPVATFLEVPQLGHGEPLANGLARMLSVVADREKSLSERLSARRATFSEVEELTVARGERIRTRTNADALEAELNRLRSAKDRADVRISDAKQLAKSAREARNAVVRRVFNEALNSVWRDLFVRLAPEEPFVPAFALPESHGSVEAALETLYRSGGRGGDPRAMLSAGNLNTAGLTLFLALHLSVEQELPWLLIDDPFQSMDEVHIAQFAALLRTLSKKLGRQVVIAVHERPLFEYLALELSPAFSGDRLITIELGRTASGSTSMRYEPHVWKADLALASTESVA